MRPKHWCSGLPWDLALGQEAQQCCYFLQMQASSGASLVAQMVKNPPAMQEIQVRSLGWEDSPGEEKDYPLQYPYLENPTGSETWWATVQCVPKSQAQLND